MPKGVYERQPRARIVDAQREQIRHLIEDQKWTQAAVAAHLGVHTTTIERACRVWRLETQRTGPRALEGHPNWRGGRYQLGRYWYVRADDHPLATKAGYVAEHRLVMETKLGRQLGRDEVVHHIDGNPENNHPDNLMMFPRNSEHLRHELTGRVPDWSEAGKARIVEGVKRRWTKFHQRKAADDGQQPQSTTHQPTSAGSTDAPPSKMER